MKKKFLLLFCVLCSVYAQNPPIVTVEQGLLKGKLMQSLSANTIYAFQGIPYAAPPIGNLRFKPPQPAPTWSGERLADKEGNDCPQIHPFTFQFVGQEDCLYLNVYTPSLSANTKLSVMVWIHGGGYQTGSGSTESSGPTFILDNNVILVTINYRLGALGFLSLGSKRTSGNYGMKDQVAALRWVQRNIARFGGDPCSVTIFGESAGASSVTLHMMSPLSKGLFHRAIAQSGSALNFWAFDKNSTESGYALANRVGCSYSSESETLDCLRQIPPALLVQMAVRMQNEMKILFLMIPGIEPCDTEKPFMLVNPYKAMSDGYVSNVPFLAGVNTHESIIRLLLNSKNIVYPNLTPEDDFAQNFARFVPSIGYKKGSTKWLELWDYIKSFYMRPVFGNFLDQYLLINTDVDFSIGIDQTVRSLTYLRKNKSPVYYYQFAYNGGLNVLQKFMQFTYSQGTAHLDELGYLFTSSALPLHLLASPADLLVVKYMTKLWTNFAKTGDPTYDYSLGITWKPVKYDPEKGYVQTRYLKINSTLEMVPENLNNERMRFWKYVLKTKF